LLVWSLPVCLTDIVRRATYCLDCPQVRLPFKPFTTLT
jgi:hypothetical protein